MSPASTACTSLPLGPVRDIVRRALAEDVPWGDVTTESLVPPTARAHGSFVIKEDGIVCGLDVAALVFAELDDSLTFRGLSPDGTPLRCGDIAAEVEGPARSILTGERTALNLLQRMSGVATLTSRYVEAIAGTSATIVDTRKTAPGLRVLDKYAVRCGGGSNHRFSLSDGMLAKDNHLAMFGSTFIDALRTARRTVPHTIKIEVEVDRIEQIEDALAGGADIILLDNMDPVRLRAAVELIGGRAMTEASGGITLDSVGEIARTGVDLISVGALTHSVRALDISLDLSRAGSEVAA